MVHQHFQLVPVLSVVDNVMLGDESTKGGLLDRKLVAERIRELADRYNMPLDPYAIIEDLPVGVRQRVEIIKALYRNADILILDEPTAVLTPQEIEGLFEVCLLYTSIVDLVATFAADGTMTTGNYFGSAGLAPFHDFDSQISQEIKDRLAEIDAGLQDGSISTGYNPGG